MRIGKLAQILALVAMITLAGGCGSNKPAPNQVFLMPAPGIYEEGKICLLYTSDAADEGVEV